MRAVDVVTGKVSVLDRHDVDTDQIIPKQFLKRVERTGFGEFLFYDWIRDGEIELEANPILVTGRNFGCGSSREHAPWALQDFGFEAIIAPSFADIFYNNCFKNGILPIKLPQEQVDKLMDDASRGANAIISIDLEKQEIRGPDGGMIKFEVDPFRKQCLLNGWDDIGLTLRNEDKVTSFEQRQKTQTPWI